MKIRLVWMLFISLSGLAPLAAGDVAIFVNLGFSDNNKRFLFGQYGFNEETSKTYAQVMFVDVTTNSYLPDGRHELTHSAWPAPGDTLDGALFELLERLAPQRKQHKINFLNRGRLIYARSIMQESSSLPPTDPATPENTLRFRDFQAQREYTITLDQTQHEGKGSSFFIDLTAKKGSETKSYVVGHPKIIRPTVLRYEIERVISSDLGQYLVFVIRRYEKGANNSTNVRYMVETVTLG